VSLTLWLSEFAQRLDRDSSVLGGISTLSRLRGFALGVLNLADIVYFSALALVFAVIAVWAVEASRRYA